MATKSTKVQHTVEDLATLRPGNILEITFHPDPGSIQVFFDLDRVIIPEESGNPRILGRRATPGAAAGGALAGIRRPRPVAVPRRKLPGRLTSRNIRDPRNPGDIMWDPPPTLPTTYPVTVEVGPAGGPYKTEDGPVQSRNLTFTGPPAPPGSSGGGGGLEVNTAPPLGVGGGAPNRPPAWVCRFTNIDAEKTYQVRVLVGFMVRRVVEVTKIPRGRMTEVFEGALRWLTPVVSVRFGAVTVGLSPDAEELLNVPSLPPVSTDKAEIEDIDFTMEPSQFEIMSARSMLKETFTELADEIRGPVILPWIDQIKLPSDFVDRLVDAALHGISADLVALATDMVPIPNTPGAIAAWEAAMAGLFARLDIPTKIPHYNPVRADDIAVKATVTITSIRAEAKAFVGTAEVFVDAIRAECFVVMRTRTRHEPHPGVAYEGEETPVQHLDLLTRFMFRIGDIDVDLEGSGDVLSAIAAEAAQVVVNRFDDDVARAVQDVVNDQARAFLSNRGLLNEIAEKVITETADRDDLLHDMRVDPSYVVLEHFDPRIGEDFGNQFLPPRRGRALGRPIDGAMPADADQRLEQINHIVVVTMENRSFDNMVGYLSHLDRLVQPEGPRTDINGLTGNERIPHGGNVSGAPVTPLPKCPVEFHPDPNHNFDGVQVQLGGIAGSMDGFMVAQRARILESTEINQDGPFSDEANIVHFQPAFRVPIYNYLAREFCILDRYFCAFPGGTQPNRVCMLTGATPVLRNSEFTSDLGYLDMPTLFEQLNENTTSWRYYEGDVGFLRVFDKYRLDFNHLRPLEPFLEERGPLPNVTFIDPNFKEMPSADPPSDDHSPTPVCRGQALLARILDRVENQPDADRLSTLLIVTYDEHGGFYDHVAPPGTDAFNALNPNVDRDLPLVHPQALTYGVRVPTFLHSPYIGQGATSPNLYDHTSITRTILQRFAPDKVQYMPARVRRSRHFGELLLATPRTNIATPPTPRQAGCRTRQLAVSTPESPVFYDKIVLAADDERVSLQRLGTHGVR